VIDFEAAYTGAVVSELDRGLGVMCEMRLSAPDRVRRSTPRPRGAGGEHGGSAHRPASTRVDPRRPAPTRVDPHRPASTRVDLAWSCARRR
jgi:hypothetical protein